MSTESEQQPQKRTQFDRLRPPAPTPQRVAELEQENNVLRGKVYQLTEENNRLDSELQKLKAELQRYRIGGGLQ